MEKLNRRPGQSLCYIQTGLPVVLTTPVPPLRLLQTFPRHMPPRRGEYVTTPSALHTCNAELYLGDPWCPGLRTCPFTVARLLVSSPDVRDHILC